MGHWFYMCLSPEGHILVPTFFNHLIQNNDFTKGNFIIFFEKIEKKRNWIFQVKEKGKTRNFFQKKN